MRESFPFYVYSGLLTKDHRKRIGSAIWEFLWCINRTTNEVKNDSELIGLVLGGKPITLTEIADELGGDKSTVSRNLEKLEAEGYIQVIRAPYGVIIKVRNSKKWKVAKMQQQPNLRKITVAKTQLLLQKYNARCKNAFSNKDKAFDKSFDLNNVVVDKEPESENEGIPSPRQGAVPAVSELDTDSSRTKISNSEYREAVKAKYIQRRARGLEFSPKDLDALDEIVREKVPLRTVIDGINKAFDEYVPEYSRDKINGLSYCVPVVLSLHVKRRKEQKAAEVPETLREQEVNQESPSSVDDVEIAALLARMKTNGE